MKIFNTSGNIVKIKGLAVLLSLVILLLSSLTGTSQAAVKPMITRTVAQMSGGTLKAWRYNGYGGLGNGGSIM